MTRILIPRSDNSSAKIIEASDWEKYFGDLIKDYVICGFTITAQCPNVLAVNVSTGNARLKGLHINNSTTCSVTCLTACSTNYIYAQICRDPCSEPQGWIFATNTTGTIPTDSMILGTATTNTTTVTAVCQNTDSQWCSPIECRYTEPSREWILGSGADGDVTISCNTTLSEIKYYNNLTITCGACVTFNFQPAILYVRCTLNVCNGTLHVTGGGACGGGGGVAVGGVGGAGSGTPGPGSPGCAAPTSGTAGSSGSGGAGGGAGGAGAASTTPSSSAAGGKGGDVSTGIGGNGGPGVALCSTAAGGGAGGGGTINRQFYNLFEYMIQPARATATGGGGGGGGSSVGGGGGGAGGKEPSFPGGGTTTGSGGTGGAPTGGAGGSGGGTLVILAHHIIVGSCGTIKSAGADGGTGISGTGSAGGNGSPIPSPGNFVGGGGGGGGGAAGSGGGGGGGGGILSLNYITLVNNGTISAPGGAGGAGSTTGGSGGAGGLGTFPSYNGSTGQNASPIPAANAGSAGSAGLVIKNRLS